MAFQNANFDDIQSFERVIDCLLIVFVLPWQLLNGQHVCWIKYSIPEIYVWTAVESGARRDHQTSRWVLVKTDCYWMFIHGLWVTLPFFWMFSWVLNQSDVKWLGQTTPLEAGPIPNADKINALCCDVIKSDDLCFWHPCSSAYVLVLTFLWSPGVPITSIVIDR